MQKTLIHDKLKYLGEHWHNIHDLDWCEYYFKSTFND